MDNLRTRRLHVFLEQFAKEYGDGWEQALARRTGMSASSFEKQAKAQRGAGWKTVDRIVERFGIDPRFFDEPALGDAPSYRDHVRRRAIAADVPDNPYWRRFLEHGYPERMKLTDDEVDWIRDAPFRGGAGSLDDYINAAELITKRGSMPTAEGVAEGKASADEARKRGGTVRR